MKNEKRRISTTVSLKHWKILEKHIQKFETQKKVLELALESLENNSNHSAALSQEEEHWMRIGREGKSAVCLIQKDGLKELLRSVDIEGMKEVVANQKPLEASIEYFGKKHLQDCNLKEVIDGAVMCGKISNWFDTINYTDDGDHYTLIINHSMGSNNSRISKMQFESVFNTYGVKTETKISERSIFMKVFKKS